MTTAFHFSTIKLWEHTDEIRSGRLPGLAPLLQLCHEHPEVEVLERVEAADSAWCLANLPRVISASRLEELGW